MLSNITTQSVVLHFPPSINWQEQQFFDFCQMNKALRIERNAQGDCEIMEPTGGETSWRNARFIALLSIWAEQDGHGVVFDSSAGFILPNGAIRSPDVAWVLKSRLSAILPEQKKRFLPLCPDFVIEIKSPSDSLAMLQNKMHDYIANGAGLGWLINAEVQEVQVFTPNQSIQSITGMQQLKADSLLQGFELNLAKIWLVDF